MKSCKTALGLLLWMIFLSCSVGAQDTVPMMDTIAGSAAQAVPPIVAPESAAGDAPTPPFTLSTPIPHTSLSLLPLLAIAIIAFTALAWAITYLLECTLQADLARIRSGPPNASAQDNYVHRAQSLQSTLRRIRRILPIPPAVFLLALIAHQSIQGTPWEGHLNEWLNLVVRWGHVTFGVAWIGTSFYFIFLENALHRGDGLRPGLAGNLWAIHGGGFYYLEKFKTAPPKLPDKLHWFKWEAYITWISGICLLTVVYYFNATSLLVDPAVSDIGPGTAIAIGIGTLILSWLVYDLLCKSPWVENRPLFFGLMFAYITLIAFFLSQYLSPRGAYIHVGAVIGTMMAGNVWRVIIPSQKAMVKAAEQGVPVDPELGRHAGLRSLHNNYFTLPVLFIMVSNHFPSTFGHALNWAVLAALTLISAGVKHYFNLKDKGVRNPFLIPAASLGMIIVFLFTAPRKASTATGGAGEEGPVDFYRVYQIMTRRCAACHSANPIDDVNVVAPNGIMFDTPQQIKAQADRIMVRAVVTKTMPQANKTGMPDAERELLRQWIEQGANIEEHAHE